MEVPATIQDLRGRRIVVLRGAARSAPLVEELRARGAVPFLMPLIDFEQPADPTALDEAIRQLRNGFFEWLIITSVTTVKALKQRVRAMNTELSDLLPAVTRVAVVGQTSGEALVAEGLRVDLRAKGAQSANGLVAEFPFPTEGVGPVFLPQADIAADTITAGLAIKGWTVQQVTAYRTVDYPAGPDYRFTVKLGIEADRARAEQLSVESYAAAAAAGGIDAVVLTSPSVARRFAAQMGFPSEGVKLVAIGRSTAAEAVQLGLDLAGTAGHPTPRGIADALADAVVGNL